MHAFIRGFKATPSSKVSEKREFILAKYKERVFMRSNDVEAASTLREAVAARTLTRLLEYMLTSHHDLSLKVCNPRADCGRPHVPLL